MEGAVPMVVWGMPTGPLTAEMAGQMSVHPRVITQATAAGELLTCPPGAEPRYAAGDRMEVLRVLQLSPELVVYLVLLPNGCTGWVPAGNVGLGEPRIGARW